MKWLAWALMLLGIVCLSQQPQAYWQSRGSAYNNPASSGAPFNPTSLITGGGGFWRADMGTTTGGGFITAWTDQSGNGNTLNNSAANTINFSATGFNTSFPAVQVSDGNIRAMRTTTLPVASTTLTMFILLSFPAGNTQSTGRIFTITSSAATDDYDNINSVEIDDASSTKISCTNNFPTGAYACGNGGNPSSAFTVGVPVLAGYVFDGTTANLWINGVVVGTGTANTNTLGTNPGIFNVGAGIASGTQPAGGTNVAFVGVTTKAMNSTDWTNLKNWSNSNWGTSF